MNHPAGKTALGGYESIFGETEIGGANWLRIL